MKTKYIISILFLSLGLVVIGQTTIYTPYGTSVSVTKPDDMDSDDRDYWDDYYRNRHADPEFHVIWPDPPLYPNLSSSMKFNCHGYAWHMYWFGEEYELNDPCVMSDTEAENYFNDPSFKECTKPDADIWWMNGGSHSAVATDRTDTLKSKWGIGPLATHHKDDHPYTPVTSVIYYKECYKEIDGVYYSDISLELCKAKYTSLQINTNVDVEIEYEDWLLIESDFVTGTGSTLYLHPE